MVKQCACCGLDFETTSSQKLYCDRVHKLPCPMCGKLVEKTDKDFSRPNRCCSKQCSFQLKLAKMKPKTCEICGEEFKPTSGVATICDREHRATCEICGNTFILTKKMFHNGVTTCSTKCSKAKLTLFYQNKYGVDHPMQTQSVQSKYKESMLAKYGVDSPLRSVQLKDKAIATTNARFGVNWALSDPEVRAKSIATMQERYGVDFSMQSPAIQAKSATTRIARYGGSSTLNSVEGLAKYKQSMLEKYGESNPMKIEEFKFAAMKSRIENNGAFWTDEIDAKAKQTWIEKYGVDNPSKSSDIQQKIKQTCMSKYGVPYGCLINNDNLSRSRISKTNLEFADKLESSNYQFEYYLDGYLYDIALPDSNILIEIDPSYTHNIIGNHWTSQGIDMKYHINKSNVAASNNLRCIHVFDWDDKDKIVDMVMPKHKIYARKCKIYRLNQDVTDKFLNDNHLQNSVRGQHLCFGLVYQGELVQVMTFGKPRYNKNYEAELLRLCTKRGYYVIGGAEKLFKFVTNNYEFDTIISYCDLSKFSGCVYSKIGMTKLYETAPQIVWSKGTAKITSNLLKARGFDQLFGTSYGKGTSNEQLMIDHGWLPVPDCGQSVYEYRKSKLGD